MLTLSKLIKDLFLLTEKCKLNVYFRLLIFNLHQPRECLNIQPLEFGQQMFIIEFFNQFEQDSLGDDIKKD